MEEDTAEMARRERKRKSAELEAPERAKKVARNPYHIARLQKSNSGNMTVLCVCLCAFHKRRDKSVFVYWVRDPPVVIMSKVSFYQQPIATWASKHGCDCDKKDSETLIYATLYL